MAAVQVTPRAAADIDAILVCLHGQGGRAAAEGHGSEFKAAIRSLAHHPEGGRKRPDVGFGLRSVLARSSVLIYRHDRARDIVFVLHILHGRRRLALDAP